MTMKVEDFYLVVAEYAIRIVEKGGLHDVMT